MGFQRNLEDEQASHRHKMFEETVSRESSKAAKMTFRLNGLLPSARLTGNAKGSPSTDIRTHAKNTAPLWGCTCVIS